jgi:hypothetical protein
MARAAGVAGRARRTPRGKTSPFSQEVRHRLEGLIGVLGNNRLAHVLGVSRSQPSRWRRGEEGLAEGNERAVLDLDYVIARLHQLWVPEVASIWLESPNAHLGGAVPLEVLRRRGTAEVIRAIDAEAEGAYA